MADAELIPEFDRQADIILQKKNLETFDLGISSLSDELGELRSRLKQIKLESVGNIPICIVVNKSPFPTKGLMKRVMVKGAAGIVDMTPVSPEDFSPIEGLEVPSSRLYLLLDVDTGRESLNISPENSLASILAKGRTPLTLEEGVMMTLFFPQLLIDKKNYNCIQMPGSRINADQRVPSIWFSKGSPRLGWCWNRNIHTWLASASALRRV